jgi:hypothetical protein
VDLQVSNVLKGKEVHERSLFANANKLGLTEILWRKTKPVKAESDAPAILDSTQD